MCRIELETCTSLAVTLSGFTTRRPLRNHDRIIVRLSNIVHVIVFNFQFAGGRVTWILADDLFIVYTFQQGCCCLVRRLLTTFSCMGSSHQSSNQCHCQAYVSTLLCWSVNALSETFRDTMFRWLTGSYKHIAERLF